MPIAKIKDWELNVKANAEFVKKSIDTQQLKIGTTGGIVHVSGKIAFTGSKVDPSADAEVINCLKNTDRMIKTINGVKDVKYSLSNWQKVGGNWGRKQKEVD
jgi:hypothetical protein